MSLSRTNASQATAALAAERRAAAPPPRVAVVDYDAGNVESVRKALAHLGVTPILTADAAVLRAASLVVFPGQGHFGQAMARLRETGLDRLIHDVVAAGTPFLGVCLGLQLLFEGSEEAPGVAGLGLLPGRSVRFVPPLKIPQIGWNAVDITRSGTPLDAVATGSHFYFVHSYHAVADHPADVVATADHGGAFTAAVARDNLFACQFHPEKSGQVGLTLLAACLARAGVAGDRAATSSEKAAPC